jgi:hypothetical protein
MKTLKITLALVAVLLLTVSGVQSEDANVAAEEPTYKEYSNQNLLATNKKKLKLQTQG